MFTKVEFDQTSEAFKKISKAPRDSTWEARLIIGVDPGESGAIAMFDTYERHLMWLPTKGIEGYKLLRAELKDTGSYQRYTLHLALVEEERVTSMMSPSAATTFIKNYGFGLGVIDSLALVTREMTPVEWQKAIGLVGFKPTADMTTAQARTARKKHYANEIKRLYGKTLTDVPAYAIDAFGILLALF